MKRFALLAAAVALAAIAAAAPARAHMTSSCLKAILNYSIMVTAEHSLKEVSRGLLDDAPEGQPGYLTKPAAEAAYDACEPELD